MQTDDIGTTPDAAARDRTTQIKARVDAATPGPWTVGDVACIPEQADRVFIAAAREDVPWLLDENERLADKARTVAD